MNRILPIVMAILLVVLVALASIKPERLAPARSPQSAVHGLFQAVQAHDWNGAFRYIAAASNIEASDFQRDLGGRDGSLRTLSSLNSFDTKVLNESGDEANVRANLKWSTALGASNETRDLKVVRENGSWKVL